MAIKTSTPPPVCGSCPLHSLPGIGLVDALGQPLRASPDNDMDRRVGYLEGAVKTMADKVTEVNSAVGALSQEMTRVVSGLGHEIGELREIVGQKIDTVMTRMTATVEHTAQETRSASRPNFLAIISIVGMAGALAAYILNGHNAEILATKSDVKQVQTDFSRAEFVRGQMDERASETNKTMTLFMTHYDSQHKELEERLSRDYQAASQAADERLKASEGKLLTVVGDLAQQVQRRVGENADHIADLQKWQLTIAETTGRVAAKQLMNEDHIKTLETQQSTLSTGYAEFRGQVLATLALVTQRLSLVSDRIWTERTDKLHVYESQDIQDLNGLRKHDNLSKPLKD